MVGGVDILQGWLDGKIALIGPEMIYEAMEKVYLIREVENGSKSVKVLCRCQKKRTRI